MRKSRVMLLTVMMAIIILYCSCAAVKEVNLIRNGSLEQGELGWNLGVSGSIDPSNKYQDKNSIKMYGISTNSWNVVTSEMFSVEANQEYILTFMSKNEALTGTGQVMIRWIAGNTTISYSTVVLRNDTDWEDYILKATSPQGTSRAQVYLQLMPDFNGAAWFTDFVFFKAEPSSAPKITSTGPIGFKGSVLTEISYTPEDRWIAGNRLQVFTNLVFGSSTKGYILLGGWLPREDVFNSFASLSAIGGKLAIKNIYLEVDGPLLGRFFNTRTTLGDLSINYSPFIMKADRYDLWYWDVMDNLDDPANYNRGRRGISFETLNPDKFIADGFLLWDGDPDQYAYGGRFSYGSAKNNLEFVFVNYEDRKDIMEGDNAKNADLSFNIKGQLAKGPLGIWSNVAQNKKIEEQETLPLSQIFQGGLTYQVGDFATISYSTWLFDKDFDPRYRDRTPKYDLQTGKKLNWNPVDKFAGQSGSGIGVAVNNGFCRLNLENRQALEELETITKIQETEFNFAAEFERVLFSLGAEYCTNQVDAEHAPLTIKKSMVASSTYFIKRTNKYDLGLEYNYCVDDNDGISESRRHILLKSKISEGPLNGAQLFAGVRDISKNDRSLSGFVCGMDLLLVREINITVRYANPNEDERLAPGQRIPRYDEKGNSILADNIIKISLNVEF